MKTVWIVLISFVATAVIVGGGTYYLVNTKAKTDKDALQSQITDLNKKVADTEKSLADVQATTSTPTTTTADPTASWKTYTNSTYGINFKYPKDWTVKEGSLDGTPIYLGLNEAGYTPKPDTDQPNSANFYLYSSISKLDTQKLSATSLNDYLNKYSALSDPVYKNKTSQKIGSLSGYTVDAGPNQFGGGKYYFAELSNKQIVKFWLFNETNSGTMSTILSTFQFTK